MLLAPILSTKLTLCFARYTTEKLNQSSEESNEIDPNVSRRP